MGDILLFSAFKASYKASYFYNIIIFNGLNASGRVSRFWQFMWYLYTGSIFAILVIPTKIIEILYDYKIVVYFFSPFYTLIAAIYMIFAIISGLCTNIRRLHDRDNSGLWLLWLIIPLTAWFVCLYIVFVQGDSSVNRYGEPEISKKLNNFDEGFLSIVFIYFCVLLIL